MSHEKRRFFRADFSHISLEKEISRKDSSPLFSTGAFTKDAIKESTRDGAPAIDLVDGDQLVEKLKQLSLGVSSKKIEVEQVTVIKIGS